MRSGVGRIGVAGLAVVVLTGCQSGVYDSLSTPFGEPYRAGAPLELGAHLPHRAYVERGKVFFTARDFGNAQRVYQKAVKMEPSDAEAWLGLAASYDRLGRFKQSNTAYKKLRGLIGQSTVYYNNRGFSFLLQGKGREAAQNFQRALSLDPNNTFAENNLRLMARVQERESLLR